MADTIADSGDSRFISFMRKDEALLIHEMLRAFSSWEPFDRTLRTQLNLVGIFLRTWLQADGVIHFFANPRVRRVDIMSIGRNEHDVPPWQTTNDVSLDDVPDIGEVPAGELRDLCRTAVPIGNQYLAVPFRRIDTPFGCFVLSFHNGLPGSAICERIRASLNVFQDALKDLLYNRYAISESTYLPSFQRAGATEAAILFCDIRESTRMIEVARMAPAKYTEMIIALIKSLLEYGSRIIAEPDVGRIHSFTGDGFVATFGEYLTLDAARKAKAACALALLSAKALVEGFARLWLIAAGHAMNEEFLGRFNEDLDLRLGVGLNYGLISFDLFGVATVGRERAQRGFYQYTAVGDHMNFTQRLCSMASQPISSGQIIYRSDRLPRSRLTAPIIASRTVAYWSRECFIMAEGADPMSDFRSDFGHKGKGHPMPGFEVLLPQLDTLRLLKQLENVHDNRFREAMERELGDTPERRPALTSVADRLRARLDQLE